MENEYIIKELKENYDIYCNGEKIDNILSMKLNNLYLTIYYINNEGKINKLVENISNYQFIKIPKVIYATDTKYEYAKGEYDDTKIKEIIKGEDNNE